MSEQEQLDRSVTEVTAGITAVKAAISHLEAQRSLLGDAAVDTAIAGLRQQLAAMEQESRAAPGLEGERKTVTVMFADISGFTALAETMDPEAVRDAVNACFDRLVPIIEKYEGTVDKFIGDEIMALFGAPLSHENDPERALRAALEIKTALQDFDAEHDTELEVHIGINTGLVIAGGIGSAGRQQYSVMGDAVNIAAHLTDLGAAGQILVGEDTYQQTSPLFEFASLSLATLKGKREPLQVYRLRGLRTQPGPQRGLASLGLQAPLVGRTDEMEHLRATIDRLNAGQGGVVSIVGEAGVGKSRLMAELRQHVSLPWNEGRCLSYGETLSYHPFLALLRSLIGVTPDADLPALETHLYEFLEPLFPHRQLAETHPYLADLLGLPLDASSQEHLDLLVGENRQWQVFQAFADVLVQLARRSPVVVVLEDLHWADPTSLALLEHVLPLSSQAPLLFLLVLRPFYGPFCQQFITNLRANSTLSYEEINLSPLSPTHSRELVEHLLIIETLSESVRNLILSRAEGNPLFLEEILRALIGQGLLQQEQGHWRVAPGIHLEQVVIPPTLQGVILARLDRLESETKAVLQMAAVIGRIFWYRVLDYVTSIERQLEEMLDQHLSSLEQVELIRQTRHHPDLEYIFKHVLVQEAAYHTLLREQRRLFHRRVAEALQCIFADNLEEQYGLLAHHYEAAGEVEQSIRYLRRAGDQARHAYALPEAEAYYRRALAILPEEDDKSRQQLLLDLGLVSMTQGEFGRAGEHYAAAFQLGQKSTARIQRSYVRRPLRICWGQIPLLNLEPGIPIDTSSGLVITQLFSGLVEFGTELNILPHVAERWEVDTDGRRYRFHLRREACWSDGHPLSAHDFVYAWRRWLHPDAGAEMAHLMYVLEGARDYHQGQTQDPTDIGVRALDDHTLEIKLATPVAYFLPLLVSPVFYPLPRHCWPPAQPPWKDPSGFVVNGPFHLVEWRRGEKETIILERNPRYCGAFSGNVGRAEIAFLDAQERLERYVADELDMCWVDHRQADTLAGQIPPERWLSKPLLQNFYCGLMPTVPPLDDRRVRQALAMAVDRSHLAKFVSEADSIPARGGFVPTGMPGHSPELSLPHDPERALDLLRQAGYADVSDLPPLQFTSLGNLDSPLMQALISQWRQLGIQIIADQCSLSALIERIHNDNPPHLFTVGWTADYPDPHNFLAEGFLQARFWRESAYWDLVAEASRTLDVRQRMALYHELDRRLVVEQALCIPLAYGREILVVQPRLQHYPMIPVIYFLLKEVVLEED